MNLIQERTFLSDLMYSLPKTGIHYIEDDKALSFIKTFHNRGYRSIKVYNYTYDILYNRKLKKYAIKTPYALSIKMEKEGSKIYFYSNNQIKIGEYNCLTKTILEYKQIHYGSFKKEKIIELLNQYEWVLNYTDNFSTVRNLAERDEKKEFLKPPKNCNLKEIFQELKEQYQEYLLYMRLWIQKYKKNYPYLEGFYNLCRKKDFSDAIIQDLLQIDKELPIKIRKIMINSAKNLDFITPLDDNWDIDDDDTYSLMDLILFHRSTEALDTNRTVKQNGDILYNLYEVNRNKVLESSLQEINFVNDLSQDNYIVIVPQDINDLLEEAKQQNNCVGHYYNTSIIDGENYIYFIRKKDNPNKSFITCRYDIDEEETVEARMTNNKEIDKNIFEDIQVLIKTVDNQIQKCGKA